IKYYGATGYAFPTIAASGKNACCLHYMDNEDIAKQGDLILFDLGCSYHMYCSDISRTFPVSGKFSPRQKQIYNIVLAGQEHVLKHIKPGITTKELNQILIKFYAKELKKIGLIQEDSEVSKYYYHGVSHHIGLDCHDLCEYTPLQAGSIISNEPGLYIAEEGIGIRIEDDILVTEDGCINLSKDILKTVDEIEAYLER
ncbi:MAG: M24 family metallopeptidase, partial [Anaeroplasmataceae bacterium]|nr:M24 family metallopeptidase [Anaeroplasmataceae bacterium]